MSAAMTTLKASELTRELIGVYAEIRLPVRTITGGISDVQPTRYVTSDGVEIVSFVRVYCGGQVAYLLDDVEVLVAVPADPCDGTPLPADPAPLSAAEAAVASSFDRAEAETPQVTARRRFAPGLWLTVLASTAMLAAGVAVGLSSPALSGGTIAGIGLVSIGGALLTRALHVAGVIR